MLTFNQFNKFLNMITETPTHEIYKVPYNLEKEKKRILKDLKRCESASVTTGQRRIAEIRISFYGFEKKYILDLDIFKYEFINSVINKIQKIRKRGKDKLGK